MLPAAYALLLCVSMRHAHASSLICNSFTSLGVDFARQAFLQENRDLAHTITPGLLDDTFRTHCMKTVANETACNQATENRALYNMEYTGPSLADNTLFVDFDVELDATSPFLQFSSKPSAPVSTAWFVIKLDKSSVRCKTQDTTLCTSPFFALQNVLFTMPLTISYLSLFSGNLNLAPDVLLHANLKTTPSRLIRMSTTTTRTAGNAAVWTSGCTPPVVTLRVQYIASEQPPVGYMPPTDQSRGIVPCIRRTIFLHSVKDSSSPAMLCVVPPKSNSLRHRLDLAISRQSVVQSLEREDYAKSADVALQKHIRICTTHALALLECSQPLSPNANGGVWSKATANGPGACVPCSAGQLNADHKRVRPCNRSIAQQLYEDCCFACKNGYMFPPNNLVTCVPECKQNYQYQTLRGICEPCPQGTYSHGALDTCQTCAQKGHHNARIDRLFGCQACDRRSLAVLDRCSPCPNTANNEPQFVPIGASVCTPCSSFGAYFLPDTLPTPTQCQPCAPGTFMTATDLTFCKACPVSTFSNVVAATACDPCPIQTYSSPNRTVCLPCPTPIPLNTEYYQAGTCNLRCIPGQAYQVASPSSVGGCRSCSSIVLPPGTYADPSIDCSIPRPCTNAPPALGIYTGPATIGSQQCPFRCKAGYRKTSDNTCSPCEYASPYNASRHEPIHSDTVQCDYHCKPFLYRDAARSCITPCIELPNTGLVLPRVSHYNTVPPKPRPHFVLDQCGVTTRVPTSPLPFLRKAAWAYLQDYTTSECGNSLLEKGEECDDGNTQSGDGCTGSTCKVETDQYWDCDLIGIACLPLCGWPLHATSQDELGLHGFVLPLCSHTAQCSCNNLSYAYMLSTTPLGERTTWMRTHLVSCACSGNPLRALPYHECTAENRGCRQCPAGHYHDDLKAICSACGSACAAAYTPPTLTQATTCSNTFSTSDNLQTALSVNQQQLNLGCVPCPPMAIQPPLLRYVPSPNTTCAFVCERASTYSLNDTYCTQQPHNGTGTCPAQCRMCTNSLQERRQETAQPGNYITSCRDATGHAWAPCDPTSKPASAQFKVASSLRVGASTECPWDCSQGTFFHHSACLPCSTAPPCRSGETRIKCNAQEDTYACIPCEGPTPFPLQIWTSYSPAWSCIADCDPQISFSASIGEACSPCSDRVCALGEQHIACTQRADADCQPCAMPPPNHAEYAAPGLCDSRCLPNYYAWYPTSNSPMQCVECHTPTPCQPGTYQSSTCQQMQDRLAAPSCLSCPNVLLSHQQWAATRNNNAQPCAMVCESGYVFLSITNQTCIPCIPTLCPLAHSTLCLNLPGLAITELVCTPCPPLPSVYETWNTPGSCTTTCKHGAARNDKGTCVLIPSLPPVQPAQSVNERAGLIYPSRALQHSAMIPS